MLVNVNHTIPREEKTDYTCKEYPSAAQRAVSFVSVLLGVCLPISQLPQLATITHPERSE